MQDCTFKKHSVVDPSGELTSLNSIYVYGRLFGEMLWLCNSTKQTLFQKKTIHEQIYEEGGPAYYP